MTQKTIEISKLFYSFVPNCGGENYQDFLKGGGGLLLGHSLMIIKQT